jgi:hypothetical protein
VPEIIEATSEREMVGELSIWEERVGNASVRRLVVGE